MQNKAYRYRLYPNSEQKTLIAKTFGCVRFVYNKCLDKQKQLYESESKHLSLIDMNNYCTRSLKQEFVFLKEVDKFSLNNAVINLDCAYKAFFRKNARFPKFKSKHKSKARYTTNYTNNNIVLGTNSIKLPKLGHVKAVIHRVPDNGTIKSATISLESDGSYYVSVLFEMLDIVKPSVHTGRAIGLDYKSDGLFENSDGNVCGSPKYSRKAQKKLAKEQRRLSRKIEDNILKRDSKGRPVFKRPLDECRNIQKQRLKVARIQVHTSNQRRDFLHKMSYQIANEYDIVCIEDLNMRSLSNKGFGNGKTTMDNGYGMFVNMLEYKLSDRGKNLVKVDRFYPSSQICSCCGNRNPAVKDIRIRTWTCPVCNVRHDRDLNAARNILQQGLRILSKKAG